MYVPHPPVQKGATLSAVCGFLVKGTGFGLCAHRIEEGNELVSDPKETGCPSCQRPRRVGEGVRAFPITGLVFSV